MSDSPHVSEALSQLRFGVTAAALAVAAAAIVQLLVVGFVHFTDVRWAEAKPVQIDRELGIVSPFTTGADQRKADSAKGTGEGLATLSSRADEAPPVLPRLRPKAEPVEANRVLTSWDQTLGDFSNLAVAVGIIAALTLGVLTLLGVAVAGGAAVPGVERAVSASVWATVLALLCVPWRDVLPTMPFAGVFSGYEALTSAAAAVEAGRLAEATMLAQHVATPLLASIIALLVAVRFRAGVAEGVIVTSMSEAEQRLELELAEIRRMGVGTNLDSRGSASLRRTVLTQPEATPPPPEPTPGVRRPQTGNGLKRPI